MTSINPPWVPRFGLDPRVARLRLAAMASRLGFDDAADDDDGPHEPGRHGPGRRGPRRGHHGHRGRMPFPPPMGPGFPFPGRGFGRRGRTSRGDVRAAVLALVAEQPRHGYEIIQEITERSGGTWRPSPGSVYPTLSQLEDEGLVTIEKSEGRRVVRLTEAGTRYVEEHRAELDEVWESVGRRADGMDDAAVALWEQLGQLHAAAHQVMAAGTPEQMSAASSALADARRTIYRLLAE